MSGSFFWYDIMTTDTKASTDFYCKVVGWTAEVTQGGGMDYTIFSAQGQGVAGLMQIPEDAAQHGARPAWLGYVAVDDVDEAAKSLEAAGGHLHKGPITIPDIIRFAVVSDPHGATFYIAKGLSANAPAELPHNAPGTISWRELMAGDGVEAFAFYEKLFGWTKVEAMDMGPMGVYQLFATGPLKPGARAHGGMMTKPAACPQPFWGFYFSVRSIDAAIERVNANGGSIINGPMEVPGGDWIVQGMDPQGAFFALVAPKR